jgi:hypothetical protein
MLSNGIEITFVPHPKVLFVTFTGDCHLAGEYNTLRMPLPTNVVSVLASEHAIRRSFMTGHENAGRHEDDEGRHDVSYHHDNLEAKEHG